jgi:hypothetical protein
VQRGNGGNLVSDISGIRIWTETTVRLLQTVGASKDEQKWHLQQTSCSPNQSIDLDAIHVIKGLKCSLDLMLVGTHITQKDQRIVVFDFANGRLGHQGSTKNGILIKWTDGRNRLSQIFGRSGKFKRLGTMEARRRHGLLLDKTRSATESRFLGRLSSFYEGKGSAWMFRCSG